MAKYVNREVLLGRVASGFTKFNAKNKEFVEFDILCEHAGFKQRHSVILNEKQGEAAMKHLRENDAVCVEGCLTAEMYANKGGEQKRLKLLAERITFLSSIR